MKSKGRKSYWSCEKKTVTFPYGDLTDQWGRRGGREGGRGRRRPVDQDRSI